MKTSLQSDRELKNLTTNLILFTFSYFGVNGFIKLSFLEYK